MQDLCWLWLPVLVSFQGQWEATSGHKVESWRDPKLKELLCTGPGSRSWERQEREDTSSTVLLIGLDVVLWPVPGIFTGMETVGTLDKRLGGLARICKCAQCESNNSKKLLVEISPSSLDSWNKFGDGSREIKGNIRESTEKRTGQCSRASYTGSQMWRAAGSSSRKRKWNVALYEAGGKKCAILGAKGARCQLQTVNTVYQI